MQVGQAAQQAVGAGMQVAQVVEYRRRKAEEEADELRVTEKLTAFEKAQTLRFYGDEKTPGYLSLKGTQASENLAGLLEGLQKDGDKLGEDLNPHQRNLYRKRVEAMLGDTDRRARHHAFGELERAKEEGAVAKQETALQAVFNLDADSTPGTQAEVGRLTEETEATIRKLARSPEAGELAVQKFRAAVVVTRISSSIQRGDVPGAEAKLEAFGDTLGVLGAQAVGEIRRRVADAKKSHERDRIKADVETAAASLISEATMPDGNVSEEKVDKLLKEVPATQRGLVRTVVFKELNQARRVQKEKTDEYIRQATVITSTKSFLDIPSSLVVSLQKTKEGAHALRMLEASWRVAENRKAAKLGKGAAHAQSAQKRDNLTVLRLFQSLDPEERASMDLDSWVVSEGVVARGVDHVDQSGLADLKREQQRAKERVNKGEAQGERQFVHEVEVATRHSFSGKKPKFGDAEKVALHAVARTDYQKFFSQHGRPPNAQETAEMIGRLVTSDTFLEEAKGMAQAMRNRQAQPRPPAPPAAPQQPNQSAGSSPAIAAAEAWLAANPNDPRAPSVRAKLQKMKGR